MKQSPQPSKNSASDSSVWQSGPYVDHVDLWAGELAQWVPDKIFDAHVHLSPPEAMGTISPARRKEPLTTFTHLRWEELTDLYSSLYKGKTVEGLIAFPLPLKEVHLEAANDYIVALMKSNPCIRGFVLPDPLDTKRMIAQYDKALKAGVRYVGVKPYFDLLGKSNYETTMDEFIHRDLLEFMDSERLVMMLHTSGTGMGSPECQKFVRSVLDDFPNIRIILAHMGRYLQPQSFLDFFRCGILDSPSIYLGMSSVTEVQVYQAVLSRRDLWGRVVFGSDLPFGSIPGVEFYSPETGPTFITRNDYSWSNTRTQEQFSQRRKALTYNTYHVIKALKDAVESANLTPDETKKFKQSVFCDNALAVLEHFK